MTEEEFKAKHPHVPYTCFHTWDELVTLDGEFDLDELRDIVRVLEEKQA